MLDVLDRGVAVREVGVQSQPKRCKGCVEPVCVCAAGQDAVRCSVCCPVPFPWRIPLEREVTVPSSARLGLGGEAAASLPGGCVQYGLTPFAAKPSCLEN